MSTPPSPARTIVSTHATADVPGRVDAPQARQSLAVDDRSHLEADASPAQDEPEAEGRDRGGDEHGELVAS